jgi:hypothetical protein
MRLLFKVSHGKAILCFPFARAGRVLPPSEGSHVLGELGSRLARSQRQADTIRVSLMGKGKEQERRELEPSLSSPWK